MKIMYRSMGLALILGITVLAAASPAGATVTVFTDRAAWQAALPGVATDDFEGEVLGNFPTPFTTAGGLQLAAIGQPAPVTIQVVDGGLVNGSRELHFRDFNAGVSVGLTATGQAFGFDYTSNEFWTVTAGGRITALTPGNTHFIGYIDDAAGLQSFALQGPPGAQGGISIDNLSRAGVPAAGLAHLPLGQARLAIDPASGDLTLLNIGSSGADGMAIHVGAADGVGLAIDLPPQPPSGFEVQHQMMATLNGKARQLAATLETRAGSSGYLIGADFTPLGAATYTVRLLDGDGRTVSTVSGLSGEAISVATGPGPTPPVKKKLTCTFSWPPPSISCSISIGAAIGGVSGQEFVITPDLASPPPIRVTDFAVMAANTGPLALSGESISAVGLTQHALGQAAFEPSPGKLTLGGLSGGASGGTFADLGRVDTVNFGLDPIDAVGKAPAGAFLRAAAIGSIAGVDGQPLGQVTITKMSPASFAVAADFGGAIGSPTHHLVVLKQGQVVFEVTGHTGQDAVLQRWPLSLGKLGGQLECFTMHDPTLNASFRIDGVDHAGDELRVLAEVPRQIDFKSGFGFLAGGGLASFTLNQATATPTATPALPCTPSTTRLCLNQGRFQVDVAWVTGTGSQGSGQAESLTPDTGYFWFFASSNVEMVIKVLDGCALNGHYWVFAGGLTDVQVVTTVTDTQSGAVKTYANLQGQPFQPLQDTSAFASCP